MKRILPLLLLVIGAVWFFFCREGSTDEYDDPYEEDRYEDDGGALKGHETGHG